MIAMMIIVIIIKIFLLVMKGFTIHARTFGSELVLELDENQRRLGGVELQWIDHII